MPVSVGSPLSNCTNASNPPAEAPMPATGNFGPVSLLSCLRAGVAVTARRSGTTRSVFRGMAGGVNRKDWRGEVRRSARGKSQRNRSVQSNSMSMKCRGRRESPPLSSSECRESGVRFRQSYALLSIIHFRPAAKPFARDFCVSIYDVVALAAVAEIKESSCCQESQLRSTTVRSRLRPVRKHCPDPVRGENCRSP